MADPFGPEEDEGGAVKSFLEHLEDLRWMIIKSGAATLLGMLICLFGVKHLVTILAWPKVRAEQRHIALLPDDTNQVLSVRFGTLPLQSIILPTNQIGGLNFGTNRHVSVELEPVLVGSNTLLAMRMAPDTGEDSTGLPLIYMDPAGPFLSSLHLAFFGGLILASPFVLFFIGQFVLPALKIIEKKYFLQAFWFGAILFLTGVWFAYYLIAPSAIKFAEQYSLWMGVPLPFLKAEDYFSFLMKFMLGMGLGFELPVVLLALVKIGVLNYKKLSAMRRYMIVGNLVLGALLTTPEVFTQIFMALALQVLFEVAVWIAWYWEREAKRKAAANGPIDV
jgi:sec-independent protein translocase protein TatC